MPPAETLLAFLPIALALNLTPGADMLFCLGQGTRAGPGAGLAAALGIAAGGFVHALAGGLGLAALIEAVPVAFEVIRWSGVAYLLYLAVQAFRAPPPGSVPASAVPDRAMMRIWREAILVSVLNPKVAIFMLALVPQFVDPAGSVLFQFLVLGGILSLGGLLVNGLVGVFAGRLGRGVAARAGAGRILRRASGLIFVGLAAKLAFERR